MLAKTRTKAGSKKKEKLTEDVIENAGKEKEEED